MSKVIGLKVTDSTYAEWLTHAEKEGLTLTQWVRSKVNLSLGESQKVNPAPVRTPKEPPKKVEPPLTAPRKPKNRACEVLGHEWTVQGLCSRCGDIRA